MRGRRRRDHHARLLLLLLKARGVLPRRQPPTTTLRGPPSGSRICDTSTGCARGTCARRGTVSSTCGRRRSSTRTPSRRCPTRGRRVCSRRARRPMGTFCTDSRSRPARSTRSRWSSGRPCRRCALIRRTESRAPTRCGRRRRAATTRASSRSSRPRASAPRAGSPRARWTPRRATCSPHWTRCPSARAKSPCGRAAARSSRRRAIICPSRRSSASSRTSARCP
mmetsp:Transcript_14499/g.57818  ORF Transcript_14499/g.57818 Transcript_14499/m.57818 type:complete len:224 (+) Transcript_14499:365-1036(+)